MNPVTIPINVAYTPPLSPTPSACPPLLRTAPSSPTSDYRRVFQTSDQMKTEFVKFLQTIFYQLDEKKIMAEMEKLLADPAKTDEQIYKELLGKIGGMKKKFAPLWQIWSLRVLKKGLGSQAAQLLKKFHKKPFHDYMEIYDRRYLLTLRKKVSLPLDKKAISAADFPLDKSLKSKLEAGSLFALPYKSHVTLNDQECKKPLEQTEKTYKPIDDQVPDQSLDLIACMGGLHHIPKERVDPFVESMSRKLRPGAVILLRDHDISKDNENELRAIATVVHSFVNAASGVSWEIESKEVREFHSLDHWTELMKKHQFVPITQKGLVLPKDPTANAMVAFVKAPQTLEELRQAIHYRNDCTRTKDSTRATWLEWGNVRSSKQYTEFIQNHHLYAFDYIGHLRQHWKYFYHYLKESRKDHVPLKTLVYSNNFSMNLFVLLAATIQFSTSFVSNIPARVIARWRHGANWRNVSNLTELEKYDAQVEKEYCNFIDHTPFYKFNYFGKIKQIWRIVAKSKEHWTTRISNGPKAAIWTLSLFMKGAISAPVRAIYTSEKFLEPELVKILIKDPGNELNDVITRWEKEKDPVLDAQNKIETVYSTPDGYKLVSLPRYRPFTKICSYFTETSKLELLEVGSQKGISVDVLLEKDAITPAIEHAKVIYEMPRLQDPLNKRYATYHLDVEILKTFQQKIGLQNIEYIHE